MYIKEKSKSLIYQIVKFSFVGAVSLAVDVELLMLFSEIAKIDALLSSAMSFTISVAVNYVLSMHYVFSGRQDKKLREFMLFVVLSAGGLFINQLIMWIGVRHAFVHYLPAKLFSVLIVSVYNFVTRKIFIDKNS